MKKIITACILLLIIGCGERHNVITWKSYYDMKGNRLPDCICRFGYNQGNEFQDSCRLYHVLDTIK